MNTKSLDKILHEIGRININVSDENKSVIDYMVDVQLRLNRLLKQKTEQLSITLPQEEMEADKE